MSPKRTVESTLTRCRKRSWSKCERKNRASTPSPSGYRDDVSPFRSLFAAYLVALPATHVQVPVFSIAYRRFHLRTRKRLRDLARVSEVTHSLECPKRRLEELFSPYIPCPATASATAHCPKIPRTVRAARSRRCLIQKTVRSFCPSPASASSEVRRYFLSRATGKSISEARRYPPSPAAFEIVQSSPP